MLGNPLPVVDNPLRLAEELAMIDMISRGRLISGFVRGGGVESLANNVNPVHNRERFEEAHDLIMAAWTRPGPFRWEGKHFQYRVVNPWALPLQKPHPPVMVPGTVSPETVVWAAKHRYPYVVLGSSLDQTKELIEIYRETAAEEGYEMGPEHIGYLIRVFVADTEEKAQEQGYNFFWQNGALNKQIREWMAPPGYATRRLRRHPHDCAPSPSDFDNQAYQEAQDNYQLVLGTPDQVDREAALRPRPARRRPHVPLGPRRLHDPRGHGALHRAAGQGSAAGAARGVRSTFMFSSTGRALTRSLLPFVILTLAACGGGGDAQEPAGGVAEPTVAGANEEQAGLARSVSAVKSYRATFTVELPNGTTERGTFETVLPDRSHFTLSAGAAISEVIVIANDKYIKMGDTWMKAPPGGLPRVLTTAGGLNQLAALQTAAAATGLNKGATETLNNKQCQLFSHTSGTNVFEYCVAEGLPLRMKVTTSDGTKITFLFADYNQAFAINAPP